MWYTHTMTQDIALNDLILTLKSLDEDSFAQFLKELLTPSELKDITTRWSILNDLANAYPQRKICDAYQTSLCKVNKCSSIFKNKKGVISKILKARYDETSI